MTIAEARPLPGGPLPVDLVNTVWRLGAVDVDWLDDDRAVREFAGAHGVRLARRDVAVARARLSSARSVIRQLFEAVRRQHFTATEAAVANAFLADATVHVDLTADGPRLGVRGRDAADDLALRAVVEAVRLVADHADRLRRCAHADCVLWFLDTSKSGRRRWCSMERCGNRTKAHRHHQRTSTMPAADDGR